MNQTESHQGLYRPEFEHDSCGTGFITNINGHKSNQIIDDALTMLENMEHRGACGCDPETGDGAGILIQLPHEFLMEECSNLEISLPEPGEYGVGMIFFPKDSAQKKACRNVITNAIEKLGLIKLGYRKLTVDSMAVGETARQAEPDCHGHRTEGGGRDETEEDDRHAGQGRRSRRTSVWAAAGSASTIPAMITAQPPQPRAPSRSPASQ